MLPKSTELKLLVAFREEFGRVRELSDEKQFIRKIARACSHIYEAFPLSSRHPCIDIIKNFL